MEIDYDYLRTGTAIGFRASHELCSNYLLLTLVVLSEIWSYNIDLYHNLFADYILCYDLPVSIAVLDELA